MEITQIIEQAKKLVEDLKKCGHDDYACFDGLYVKSKEFLRIYAGPNSEFFIGIDRALVYGQAWDRKVAAIEILTNYISYIEAGLLTAISPERQAQLDVVSDFLEQAIRLLDDKHTHPAVPAIIIGASLEEYLRTWVEAEEINLGNRKPSIDSYASSLRFAELITKQDMKDITSWAGLRNYAAHGEWEMVENREYVRIVLEGVNLFMRKYSG